MVFFSSCICIVVSINAATRGVDGAHATPTSSCDRPGGRPHDTRALGYGASHGRNRYAKKRGSPVVGVAFPLARTVDETGGFQPLVWRRGLLRSMRP